MRYLIWGSCIVVGLLGAFGVLRWGVLARPSEVVVTSSGPTITQIESLGLLTVTRVHVADVLVAEGHSYRGSWLVKGDALLAVDCRKAKLVTRDESRKSAAIRLPPPQVLQPRVNHERTQTWSVEKSTWIPFTGDPDRLRDGAMRHAQQLVETAARRPEMQEVARENAELIFKNMYRMIGWSVRVEWMETEPIKQNFGGPTKAKSGS